MISKFHKVFQTLDEAEAFAKELGLSASEVLVEIYNPSVLVSWDGGIIIESSV